MIQNRANTYICVECLLKGGPSGRYVVRVAIDSPFPLEGPGHVCIAVNEVQPDYVCKSSKHIDSCRHAAAEVRELSCWAAMAQRGLLMGVCNLPASPCLQWSER